MCFNILGPGWKLAKKVDIPIVSFHWGVEKNNYPEEFQKVLAHEAVDAGARTLVSGSGLFGHPAGMREAVRLMRGV